MGEPRNSSIDRSVSLRWLILFSFSTLFNLLNRYLNCGRTYAHTHSHTHTLMQIHMDHIIGRLYYGQVYEYRNGAFSAIAYNPRTTTRDLSFGEGEAEEEEGEGEGEREGEEEEEGGREEEKDNRHVYDDGKAQTLTQENIAELKQNVGR